MPSLLCGSGWPLTDISQAGKDHGHGHSAVDSPLCLEQHSSTKPVLTGPNPTHQLYPPVPSSFATGPRPPSATATPLGGWSGGTGTHILRARARRARAAKRSAAKSAAQANSHHPAKLPLAGPSLSREATHPSWVPLRSRGPTTAPRLVWTANPANHCRPDHRRPTQSSRISHRPHKIGPSALTPSTTRN